MKTISDLYEGDKVHGLNGYYIVRIDNKSPFNLFYSFQSETKPEDWDDCEIEDISDDDD